MTIFSFPQKAVLTSLFLVGLPVAQCVAQEMPMSALPPKMQTPIPDQIIFHMFLRHVAALELQAQAAQLNGKLANPWRNHILHKFGLTIHEQEVVTPIALQYDAQCKQGHAQEEAAVKAYKAKYFSSGKWSKGQSLPAPSEELIELRKHRDVQTQQAIQRVAISLGPVRFASLNSEIHARIGIRALAAKLKAEQSTSRGAQ